MVIEKVYILCKPKKYSYTDSQIFGAVRDKETAERWVNWAGGIYYEAIIGAPINIEKALDSNADIELKKADEEKKVFVPADPVLIPLETA
jgi:hypothetical protein